MHDNTQLQGQDTRERMFDFIVQYISNNGFPPSTREIRDGVHLASTSGVNHHLHRMHEDGIIEMVNYQPRCIRVPGYRFVREE